MRRLHAIGAMTVAFFCTAASVVTGAPPVKLMFGAPTRLAPQMQFLDFKYVTPEEKFEAGKPWGWTDASSLKGWVYGDDRYCSIPADVLLEHKIKVVNGQFTVAVPNGPALVRLWLGEWYREFHGYDHVAMAGAIAVKAEGRTVIEESVTFQNVTTERWYNRGQSEVWHKTTDRWARQVKPILDEYEFAVDIADGALTLDMKNVPLVALVVLPGGTPDTMKPILAAMEEQRRKEMEARHPWKPRPDEAMPRVRPEDTQRGFAVFRASIDQDIYPWTRPVESQLTDTIKFFAMRGEQETARFGILPLKELTKVTVEVGDFAGSGGASLSLAECADLWAERYTERGSPAGDAAFDPLSDVLLEVSPIDCEAGTPRMYTLDVRIPRNAAPGDYAAPVTFKSDGREIGGARILLRILKPELARSPVQYNFQAILQSWTDRIPGASKEDLRRVEADRVRFIGKYGFNVSYFATRYDGQWYSFTGKPGDRHISQTPAQEEAMDWWYKLIMTEGNATDWIMFHWPGGFWANPGWTPHLVFKWDGTGKISDVDRSDLVRCISEYNALMKKKGYPEHYWYGSGEPDNFGMPGVERGNEYAQVVHDAGGKTLCAVNGPAAAKYAPPFHDIFAANSSTPITEELLATVAKLGHKFGSHNTGDSRFLAGYQFWRLGAVMKFQEVILDPSYTVPYAYLPWNFKFAACYFKSDGGWRPSVRWLRYREGRDDFLYMWNIERLIERVEAAGVRNSQAVTDATDFLRKMKEDIFVDVRKYYRASVDPKEAGATATVEWSPARYERYRSLTASLLMNLDNALTKGQ